MTAAGNGLRLAAELCPKTRKLTPYMAILFIKNMVCNRCVMVVKQLLETQGLHPETVVLGEATIKEDNLTEEQQQKLDAALIGLGFERIDDRKSRLIEA